MQTAPQHVSALELEQRLGEVLASPREIGRLEAIVVRPAANQRRRLMSAALSPEGGIDGDRWVTELEDGPPDLRSQVSLMNARFLRQVAVEDESICLAGDNLIVDLDLGEENLPPGSRLAIGEQVVIEITEQPHTGCSKFAGRYGNDSRAFMNDKGRKGLHLRGRYAKTISGGTIAVGDAVRKLSASSASRPARQPL